MKRRCLLLPTILLLATFVLACSPSPSPAPEKGAVPPAPEPAPSVNECHYGIALSEEAPKLNIDVPQNEHFFFVVECAYSIPLANVDVLEVDSWTGLSFALERDEEHQTRWILQFFMPDSEKIGRQYEVHFYANGTFLGSAYMTVAEKQFNPSELGVMP